MKKKSFRYIYCLIGLFVAFSLCGCTDKEILTEKLQTAVIELEDIEEDFANEIEDTEKETEQETRENKQEEKPDSFLYQETYCYAYETLNETEQLWYEDIAECLGAMQKEVRLNQKSIKQGMDETDIDRIFQCVLMDHPELFYVEGYTYTQYNRGDKAVAIRFSGTYSMEEEQAFLRKAEIDEAVQPLLAEGEGLTDDYDKVKYVYDTLICNTEYDLEAPDNQNIYSVFVNHKSVCQGYAKAVQYLLDRMGVECTLVQGDVDTGESHAWNLVKVNGSYYYVDATWGDASYQPDEEDPEKGYVPRINYDYLCVTTQQLLRTHILDSYVPMPVCVDEKDNYYAREGALFVTYDREQMHRLFEKCMSENRMDVTVKCADAECFRQIMTAMVDEQEVFDYFDTTSKSIAYSHNEKQLSMTFWVTNE